MMEDNDDDVDDDVDDESPQNKLKREYIKLE